MPVDVYADMFFAFERPEFIKSKKEIRWNVSGDREMLTLAAAFGDGPMAMKMSFQREYAERYDWLGIQMMLNFMLTDDKKPLRFCSYYLKCLWRGIPTLCSALPDAKRGAVKPIKRAKMPFDG